MTECLSSEIHFSNIKKYRKLQRNIKKLLCMIFYFNFTANIFLQHVASLPSAKMKPGLEYKSWNIKNWKSEIAGKF